jgi:hypothetical protein
MRVRRTVTVAVVLCTLSASVASSFPVTDWLLEQEHRLLNGWKDTILSVLRDEVRQIQEMAQRLSVFTDLAKYAAADAPRWRTRRIDDPLPSTEAYMNALNGGDPIGHGYEAVARRRAAAGDVLASLGEDEVDAEHAIRSALATLDLADSAIITGTHQTGQIRGNRRRELNAIAALEQDVTDPDTTQSTTAVLDKVSAAGLIRAHQQQTRLQLLAALNEQLLVDAKRGRDTEAAAMNMQLGRLLGGRAVAASLVAGSAQDLRTWRQP